MRPEESRPPGAAAAAGLRQSGAKMSPESKKLFNIIILGIAFMFMFTAFQTCGNVAVSWVCCPAWDGGPRGASQK